MTARDPRRVTLVIFESGRRRRPRAGDPDQLVLAEGKAVLPTKVDWHQRPVRVRDVPVTVRLSDGEEVEATTIAYDRLPHADGQTAVAFRDVFGMSDDTFRGAADLRRAVALADELLRCRRAYNVDRLI